MLKTGLLFIALLIGCSEEKSSQTSAAEGADIPDHIKKLDSLKVYSPDTQEYDTVTFKQEQVLESNEEVFIKGYIGETAVDNQGRIFIVGSVPGTLGIYVFNPDGSHLTTFSRFGRGPGEFEAIGSLDIRNKKLFVFDPRLQKFSVFSLEDFSLLDEELIQRDKVQHEDTLAYRLKGDELHATNDGNLLLKQRNLALNKEADIPTVLYSRVSNEGELMPGRVLELERFRFYFPDTERSSEGYIRMPRTMPFGRSSLVAISDDGPIYTAWTEDILIKVHDEDGNYQRAIYYPYDNSSLTLSEAKLSESKMDLISENKGQVPDSWPALHAIEVDDENRLWVFSITDSDSTYEGWVLEEDGELIAKFSWPGERSQRSVMGSSYEVIVKDGYLYSHHQNMDAGIDRIVKYRIEFEERQ
nr:6-bladed beta-propeller [Fodinibius salicampi]